MSEIFDFVKELVNCDDTNEHHDCDRSPAEDKIYALNELGIVDTVEIMLVAEMYTTLRIAGTLEHFGLDPKAIKHLLNEAL